LILFCIPYAGASATIYYKWEKYLNDDLEIYPIELAGRGARFTEKFYKDIAEASNDIYKTMLPLLNQKYAIFGHSMGGILAYDVYKKIIQDKQNAHIKRQYISKLPDNEFLEKILLLGGTTKELVYTDEFREFYLPVLKNDIKLLDDYKFIETDMKINCPVTVLNGDREDPIDEEAKNCFNKISSNKVNFCTVSGDHFFINKPEAVMDVLKSKLFDFGKERCI